MHANAAEIWAGRKEDVKKVFLESWHDYVKHGWGYDIYSPVKQKGKNIGVKPLGWIIVDSLDTLMLMDCKDELEDARNWVDKELDYNINSDVNVFETTIRMLGGLLSAHYLSDDAEDETVYLEKAVHLGNKLMAAFDTPSGIPVMEINLQREKPGRNGYPAVGASTAEIATLQLEFKYLATLTGEAYFWEASEKVMAYLNANQFSSPGVYNTKYDGLAPIYVNQNTGKFNQDFIRLGSRGDSYYEYLLKQYLQTDEDVFLDMYEHAFQGIKKHLVKESYPSKLVYLGELPKGIGGPFDDKMDHLVCFIGGLFALGATRGLTQTEAMSKPWWNASQEDQLNLGKELAKTCYYMYHDTPGTGLSPEIVVFNSKTDRDAESESALTTWSMRGDFFIKNNDKHNLQRPETVETLYYLYKITGDIKYREWGWEIFLNFVRHTKVTDADGKNVRYTTLKDCTVNPAIQDDNMESFWLAETLKYLYLLFDDSTGVSADGKLEDGKLDIWDIKNMVFNTEAHPLPKFEKGNFVTELNSGAVSSTGSNPVTQAESNQNVKEEQISANDVLPLEKALEDESNNIADIEYEDSKQKGKNLNHEAAVDENLQVAHRMKASGEKPQTKQPVAKSLEEQMEEAISESNEEIEKSKVATAKDDNGSVDKEVIVEVGDIGHEVADRMKTTGEKPKAKQPVAKSLEEQAKDAMLESDLKSKNTKDQAELGLESEKSGNKLASLNDDIADPSEDPKNDDLEDQIKAAFLDLKEQA